MLLKCVQLIISQMFCPFSTSLILESEKNIQCEIKGCCARMWSWVQSVPSHWRYWHQEKKFSREIWPLRYPAMPTVQKNCNDIVCYTVSALIVYLSLVPCIIIISFLLYYRFLVSKSCVCNCHSALIELMRIRVHEQRRPNTARRNPHWMSDCHYIINESGTWLCDCASEQKRIWTTTDVLASAADVVAGWHLDVVW